MRVQVHECATQATLMVHGDTLMKGGAKMRALFAATDRARVESHLIFRCEGKRF
jgi:hypothetical protein